MIRKIDMTAQVEVVLSLKNNKKVKYIFEKINNKV